MDINNQILLYLFIYLVFIIGYSHFLGKNQSAEDFLISSRNRSWFSIAMSKYATTIGATWFITYTAYIYEFGIGVFSLVIGYSMAMIIFAYYITPKLYNISKKEKFIKLGDIVYFKTKSKKTSEISNILSSVIIFLGLLVVVVGGANLIAYFNILSYELSLISIVGIVLIYLYGIGYKGVVTTDIVQSIIITLVLIVISYFLFSSSSIEELSKVEFKELSIGTVIGFLIYGVFSTFSFIDRYQVLFSGKSEKEIKKGFLFVIPLILISVFLLLIVGYFVRNEVTDLDKSLVFLKAIELYLPTFMIPIAIVMFFAAVMSSIDSYVYGISSHFNLFNLKNKIKNIRVNTFITLFIITILAFFIRDIVEITIFVAGLSLVLSIPMIYIFWGKYFEKSIKSSGKFIITLIFSFIGFIIGLSLFGLNPIIALFPIVFGTIGLLFNSKKLNKILS